LSNGESVDGGLDEFWLFDPSCRRSPATSARSASTSMRSASTTVRNAAFSAASSA